VQQHSALKQLVHDDVQHVHDDTAMTLTMLTRECALVPHQARIVSVLTWRQEDLLAVHSCDLHARTRQCQHWRCSGRKHA